MKLLPIIFALTSAALAQVSYERIQASASEPGNWLTYSGDYLGHHHSALKKIDRTNVGRLKLAWAYQVRTTEKIETTPLVVDGIMYLSEPGGSVTALDTRTARPRWGS